MMFFDYNENFTIETHYQNCLTKVSNFESVVHLAGDVNKHDNGFRYEVKGQDAKAGPTDTTWQQQNVVHPDRKVRKIYRFALADAPPFPEDQIPIKY
jgi:hypothetical protein